jgi:hypothetical protein
VIKVCEVFGDEYLKNPNEEDITRVLAIGEERGFPCMLGSIVVCTGVGIIALKNGMACLKAM